MSKTVWRIMRSLLFLVVGLIGTVFIRPELKGTLENYIGYALLVLAAVDIASLIITGFKGKVNKAE